MKRSTLWLVGGAAIAGLVLVGSGGGTIIDIQEQARNVKYKKSGKAKRTNFRDWDKVTGITLHQVGAASIKENRIKNITSHLYVDKEGRVFLIHPLNTYLYASDDLNRDTIAIEVEGNFAGVKGDPKTVWKPGGGPTELSSKQLGGIRSAIAYAISQVKKEGGRIKSIYAHRQGEKQKGIDPGQEIWFGAGEWAMSRYGLDNGGDGNPNYTRGGKPIPAVWRDPRARAAFDVTVLDYVPDGIGAEDI